MRNQLQGHPCYYILELSFFYSYFSCRQPIVMYAIFVNRDGLLSAFGELSLRMRLGILLAYTTTMMIWKTFVDFHARVLLMSASYRLAYLAKSPVNGVNAQNDSLLNSKKHGLWIYASGMDHLIKRGSGKYTQVVKGNAAMGLLKTGKNAIADLSTFATTFAAILLIANSKRMQHALLGPVASTSLVMYNYNRFAVIA